MRHPAALGALAAVLVSAHAMASAPVWPVAVPRHDTEVTYLQNLSRIAVFGGGESAKVREALGRHKIDVEGTTRLNGVNVLTLSNQQGGDRGAAELELAANELLAVPGVSGVGPVFFDGDALTVSTGRIWVFLPAGMGKLAAGARLQSMGLSLEEYIEAGAGVAIGRPLLRVQMMQAVQQLKALGHDVEPELMRRLFLRMVPTDKYFADQWLLRNTGDNVLSVQNMTPIGGTPYADIRASDAWDITTGSPDLLVGVIDSGTDCTHPELANKCVSPYNAVTGLADATPPTAAEDYSGGHGTSVTGIIAAPMDGVGMVGVCPSCRIVPVRLIEASGYVTDAQILNAYKHVVDAGAAVINNSWGPALSGTTQIPVSSGELQGMKYAATGRGGLGTFVVYASGNDAADTQYLGQLKTGLVNVIGVAASNQYDRRAVYSNFGQYIDVAAPSNDMYQSPAFISLERVGAGDLASDYTRAFGGTSGAAPMVSGVAALIIAASPALTAAEVREILTSTADKVDADGAMYDAQGHSPKYGFGRVNAYNAVLAATGATDPTCDPPAASEDCAQHLDENCDGFVDETCSPPSVVGTPCTTAADCGSGASWQCPSTGKMRGLCTYDCDAEPCPSGSTCVNGGCALDCSADHSCGSGGLLACTDDVFGLCVRTCAADTDCETDYLCDPQLHTCKLNTDGKPGSPCTSDECKGLQASCYPEDNGYPGGYCTHECTIDLNCEDHGKCIASQHGTSCFKSCTADTDCRPGYFCVDVGPRAGTCYKPCTRDSHCRASQTELTNLICDMATGRCIDTALDGGVEAGDAEADAAEDGADAGDADSAAEGGGNDPDGSVDTVAADAGGGGCGCHAAGAQGRSALWGGLAVLLGLAASRRSRRGRGADRS